MNTPQTDARNDLHDARIAYRKTDSDFREIHDGFQTVRRLYLDGTMSDDSYFEGRKEYEESLDAWEKARDRFSAAIFAAQAAGLIVDDYGDEQTPAADANTAQLMLLNID